MAEVVVSPLLPAWILDTFEGRIINDWIGHHDHGGGMIEFSGITDTDGEDNIRLMRLTDEEVTELAAMAREAGTPIGAEIARVLSNARELDIYNDYFGQIDIGGIQMEVDVKDPKSPNRMMEIDDLLQSLISRFPDQIPYTETSWAGGGTFITPAGIEWFKTESLLEARREEYLSSVNAAAPKA